jgi:hypothetical protein
MRAPRLDDVRRQVVRQPRRLAEAFEKRKPSKLRRTWCPHRHGDSAPRSDLEHLGRDDVALTSPPGSRTTSTPAVLYGGPRSPSRRWPRPKRSPLTRFDSIVCG